MKAIAVNGDGDAATLDLVNIDKPSPGKHQVLVKIKAAGINRTDLRRVQQHFKEEDGPHVAGLEFAGEIVELGPEVNGLAIGDGAAAMAPRAYADYALADARTVIKLQGDLGWPEAAALPVWYMTAHNALFGAGEFARGQVVLVTAASSGIGIATIQIAKQLGARKIIGTSTSSAKAKRLLALGLDDLVVAGEEKLAAAVDRITQGSGADVIIDMVGAGLLDQLIEAAALGGRIVSVGRMGGFTDRIDLDKLALKRLKLVGVTFRSLDIQGKQALRDAAMRDISPMIENGKIRPLVDRSFPLAEAADAQDYMKSNRHFGKVVLIP